MPQETVNPIPYPVYTPPHEVGSYLVEVVENQRNLDVGKPDVVDTI
jgi:hypothetical protein